MNWIEIVIICSVVWTVEGESDPIPQDFLPWGGFIECFECDSRYHKNCADPFNTTLPDGILPVSRLCRGCCVKLDYQFADGSWVERTCAEKVVDQYKVMGSRMNLPKHGYVNSCSDGEFGYCRMCLCNGRNCNDAGRIRISLSLSLMLLVGHLTTFVPILSHCSSWLQ